jgi:hypothetical protein
VLKGLEESGKSLAVRPAEARRRAGLPRDPRPRHRRPPARRDRGARRRRRRAAEEAHLRGLARGRGPAPARPDRAPRTTARAAWSRISSGSRAAWTAPRSSACRRSPGAAEAASAAGNGPVGGRGRSHRARAPGPPARVRPPLDA